MVQKNVVANKTYKGPKKSLLWMKNEYPEAFAYYSNALLQFTLETAEKWIDHLETAFIDRKQSI